MGCGNSTAKPAAKGDAPKWEEVAKEEPAPGNAGDAKQEPEPQPAPSAKQEPEPEKPPTFREGLFVTTVDGKEGTIVSFTDEDVTLKIAEGEQKEVTVPKDSIYVVKVTVVSITDVRIADWFGKADPYVTVEIEGKPETRQQTRTMRQMTTCTFNEDFELLGYTPGANLVFFVQDEDMLKKADLLGKYELENGKFANTDFDEEVELPEASAKKKGAFLKLKVSLSHSKERMAKKAKKAKIEDTAVMAKIEDTVVRSSKWCGC
jgi:hypothetical protein